MDNKQKLSVIQALNKMNMFGNVFTIKKLGHFSLSFF